MAFPSNDQFTPIEVGGVPLFDVVGDENPPSTDIVGNSTFPAGFFAYDGTNVYFRIRLDGDPRNTQLTGFRNFSWGVLINTTGVAGTYNWLFNVDGLNNRVSLIQNTIVQVNSWTDQAEGTNGSGAPNVSRPITNFDFARVSPADSSIGGTQDFFLDWYLPANVFFSTLGITETSLIRIVSFTSANANNYNKDSLRTSEGFSFTNAFSDPVTPEDADVRARLRTTKQLTSGPTLLLLGQQATWTGIIRVQNNGESQATTIFLQDILGPDNISSFVVNSVSQGLVSYNPATKQLTWSVGNLGEEAQATLTFTLVGSYTTSGTRLLDRVVATGVDSYSGGTVTSNTTIVNVNVLAAATINGTITDQSTGLVLPNATVTLLQGVTVIATTTSNAAGFYSFTNLAAGNYTVQASRTNYTTASVNTSVSSGSSQTVNIALQPLNSTITGNVSSGGPIANATIVLTNPAGTIVATTTTNGAGNYTFTGIIPGSYNLSVTAAGFQSQTAGVTTVANQTSIVNFVLLANPGAISGTVRDSLTNAPIQGSTVELLTQTGILLSSTVTDAAGLYTFGNLAPGSYQVRAVALGYSTSTVSVQVVSGATTTVNLFLQQNPGAVAGQVRDAATQLPIQGATVQAVDSQGFVIDAFTTDANGQYAFNNLLPGPYTFVFTASGYGSQTKGATVTSNTTTILDAELTRIAGTLTGTVTDPGSAPIPNATVTVFFNNVQIASVLTDASGNYTIPGLAPGSYTVVIGATNFSTVTLGTSITGGQTTILNATLTPNPGTLTGLVQDTGANPLAGVNITVTTSSGTGVIVATTVTGTDGTYTITGLAPGNYIVVASNLNFQQGSEGATITSGATTVVNFILTANPGSLAGTITNAQTGAPIAGANVQVRILDAGGTVIATVSSDINGQYSVGNLAPGIYTVVAAAPDFQTNSATVQVVSNQTAIGDVALVPNPGSIFGTVTSSIGSTPIGGATVSIINSGGILVTSVITDPAGNFTVGGLGPDTYTVSVIAQDFQSGSVGAVVVSGQTTPVAVQLQPFPGRIIGTVTPEVANTIVELRDVNNVFIDSFVTNPDGTYSFNNLAPGVYTVTASAPNYTSAQGGATVTSGGTAVVNLTIIPNPASASGQITTTGGVPLPTSFVQVLNSNGILVGTGSSDANGFYIVGGLPAGSYTVVANAPNYGQQVRGITLTIGQVLTNVDFVLTPDTGNLTGQVTDRQTGNVLSGASVVVLDATTQLPVATTTTSLFGNYVLNGLGPGTYIVTTSLANYSTEQVGAIIISNQNSTANISLQPNPGTISGNVVDVNGNPITGNNIQISVLNENNVLIVTLLANPDGTYQVPQLPPGTYFVTASAPGFASSTVSAIVTAGATVPVTNVLTANPVTLTATVLILGTSTPIAGSQVQVKTASNIVIATGTTDAGGNVTFTGLPAGTLIVAADAQNFGTDSKSVFAAPGDVLTVQLFLPDDPGQVVGVVTNLATGAPIPNATITLTDNTGVIVSTAVTNTAGQYSFSGVTPGTYRLTANATNFGPEISGVTVAPNAVSNVSFALQPNPGIITGIVRDSVTNLPIPNATIAVRVFSGDGPIITTTLTDANGFFQTTHLSPRSYVVLASKEGFGTATVSAEVLSGQVTNVELFLTPNPGAVQGTVRDAATGLPIGDTLVRAINNQGTIIAFIHTDSNGFYYLGGLPPGDYTITAVNPLYQAGFAETLIQSNVTNTVNLSLQPNPASLSGLVFDAVDGSPLPGTVIEVRLAGTNVLVRRVTSDENGRYIITGLPTGTFDVVAELQNYMITTNTIFLTAGESEVLNIPMQPFPATIRGTVVNAVTLAPISGALVKLVIANTDIEVTSILTSADGTYTLSNIAVGQYDVIFSASGYANVVVPVILEPNEVEVVDAFLDPNPGTLTGRVFDQVTGASIQGALVRVFNQDGTFITSTLTDANGIYELPGIAEGLYTVIYSAEGYGAESRTIAIPAGATVTVDVGLLAESSAIQGTVRDAAIGLPIPSALVQIFTIGTTIPIASVLTDQSGQYFISGILPEEYRVVYSAPTYQSETFILFFNPGETKTVDAELTRLPSSIVGVVTDVTTGLPITNATVTLFIEGTEIAVASSTTDQDGNYVLTGLSAGTYSLRFEAFGYQTAAVPIQLGFAETLTVNQALRLEFGSVTGTIREALTGEPIRNSLVLAFSVTGVPLGTAITDINGNYLIDGLPQGPIVLVVRAVGFQTQTREVAIIGGQTIQENFNLLGDPAVITGFITDIRTGEPISQALVQIYPFGSDVPIRSTLSAQNGFYILFGLPPGRYVIRVRAFGYPEKFVEVTLLEGQVLRLDIQLGNVNPPPPNDLRPECIKADKLYDWVFAPFRESQKVMIPPDCRGIVVDALALGEDVTISCSTGAASCRVIGYENGRPGVVNVRIEIPVTLTLETEDGGSCVIEYRAYLDRSLAVCIPDGLNAGNIDCSLLEVKCMADGGVLTDQFFQINLLACLQIEVHANVTLEVLAEFCFPRGNPEFVNQDAISSCDFPEWPPGC
ncbi:carboxypeptidase regulatory-like domain-containing protein [Rossellomorea marisflavi]|uniref:carboxypeptidase regulatory-like domain-containing protein n=1 Tax=Rossellomorea marisflavi TaxID=189381 RepID=UPI002041D95A|nr:carboxypeptidase regulatory-like domain-containing protein [Rossellomorea marisflavi]MCM2605594.1 carboxypeptidase regulatory-like domain-containing protein [Rossellomorea marisflavi]